MKLSVGVALVAMALVISLSTSVSGGYGRRRHWRGRSRCHYGSGQDDGERQGDRYTWTMSGEDEEGLTVTYTEKAFAPDNSTSVLIHPVGWRQSRLGLVPAKIAYDFSSSSQPVVVIRHSRHGRGSCILLDSDVDSYDEMIQALDQRNRTNIMAPGEELTVALRVEVIENPDELSPAIVALCSDDRCRRRAQPTFYRAVGPREEVAEEQGDDEEVMSPEDEEATPSFALFNTRVSISGIVRQPSRHWYRYQQRRYQGRNRGCLLGRNQRWDSRHHRW